MNLLFVCMCNLNRSPTFENYFKKHHKEYNVKSAGIYGHGPATLTPDLMSWADKIYTMDVEQEIHIKKFFKAHYHKVHTLGISDQYNPDEPKLREIIGWLVHTKKLPPQETRTVEEIRKAINAISTFIHIEKDFDGKVTFKDVEEGLQELRIVLKIAPVA